MVGGGPAGLNAALVLGRCRRTVLLFDDEKPRNAMSRALRGFLGSDGSTPRGFAKWRSSSSRRIRRLWSTKRALSMQ